jgi:hypothetical protein
LAGPLPRLARCPSQPQSRMGGAPAGAPSGARHHPGTAAAASAETPVQEDGFVMDSSSDAVKAPASLAPLGAASTHQALARQHAGAVGVARGRPAGGSLQQGVMPRGEGVAAVSSGAAAAAAQPFALPPRPFLLGPLPSGLGEGAGFKGRCRPSRCRRCTRSAAHLHRGPLPGPGVQRPHVAVALPGDRVLQRRGRARSG